MKYKSSNNKLILDVSKIYGWIGVLVSCFLVLSSGESANLWMLGKYALILPYLYGNSNFKSWAVIGAVMSIIAAGVGLITYPDFGTLFDFVGFGCILYYAFKIDR